MSMRSSSAARRPASPPSEADRPGVERLRIDRRGADGDGGGPLADGTPAYAPLTLPGEEILARPVARRGAGWAVEAEVLSPSQERAVPPCRHFGPCGGCALQHWADAHYAGWKEALAGGAPRRRTPPGARRRIQLAMERQDGSVRIGLHARRSHAVVNMQECVILHPALFAAVQALRPVLARLGALRREGSALFNLLDTGPDLLLRTDRELTATDRTALAAYAEAARVPRVWWARGDDAAEPAAVLGPASVCFGGRTVTPPPGAFLQASREGEAAIVAAVLDAVPSKLTGRSWAAELFAGCGTISLPLSERLRVVAWEGDRAAHAALRAAGGRVDARLRDLARQPLTAAELKGAAIVVLDPPWAGAGAVMPAIAASGVRRILYVSCNPAALARDETALTRAGYRRTATTAIDQFLWSARVEAVAVYDR